MDDEKSFNINYMTQGVTTVFSGNDGYGPIDIAGTLQALEMQSLGTNVALYVGHASVRKAVLGMDDRAPTGAELERMRTLVRTAMEEGAFGLSSGLYYAPGSYASTEEVIALAREIKPFYGVYDSHIRDESTYNTGLVAAVREAIEIGRQAGVGTHISHIKALGVDVHGMSGEVIAAVNAARAAGLDVTADQYPWLASGTSIAASLVPRWAMAGGRDALLARLDDATLAQKIAGEMRENLRRRGGATKLLIVGGKDEWQGKTLGEIAQGWNVGDITAAIRIVQEGDAPAASFNMAEADVKAFMAQPWVMTGSDGSTGHPRKFATFSQKFKKYVREQELLTPGQFVRASSALAADTFGLKGRGYLKPGYIADIVIFDPETFAPKATYAQPERLSEGVQYLFIDGKLAIGKGVVSGVRAGRGLRKSVP